MPSRQLLPSPPQHHNHHLLTPILAATLCFTSLLLLFIFFYLRAKKPTTPPPDSKPPHRYSYSLLRRATNSFSTHLGHGGFGTVYSGNFPIGKSIAVKLMDSSSYQGEREFHNELFFASNLHSRYIVTAFGFSSDSKRRRFLLVYDLMQKGNLQDALLHRKCPELMDWKKRFNIVLDIARGVQYLHSCDPPVIHGDIKPSNILLDGEFFAKIGDFGLARLKSEPNFEVFHGDGVVEEKKKGEEGEELACEGGIGVDDCGGSVIEETESVNCEEGSLGLEQSPEGFVRVPILETSPQTIASPETVLDKVSVKSEKNDVKKNGKWVKSNSMRDWKVKEHVMEWIGKEVNKEKPKSEWFGEPKLVKAEKKKRNDQLEWWESMEEETIDADLKKKRRPVREWWKEEHSEELARKKKKKKHQTRNGVNSDDWWVSDDALNGDKKKRNRRSRNNRGGADLGLDGLSGDPWRARMNSYDSAASGEIPKSGGVSSTPSMRGTVCYVAPEYGYGGDVSEKCDVYSFGVLVLVVISGRRPLQVNGSPMSEFQRANLLSWARYCARKGKLIELVDQSIQSLDKEQALLCIKVVLLCLLKSPARRPSMKEVLGMLSGELEPPQVPVEYSPSTPSRFPFKSRNKGR
ncbi:hypothetical protein TanjilG_07369 [Lupinus angustifolius]|uniref:non-specific serine/threonine protein kinase n=1 Tax=Lupinus angustifolius TaxID=3871 RepID=A0A4P1R035_LUPAN|nr:PREDICTED: receptor-like serine/threonine-protein kinase At4g25390 [Lupinus angustifolius]OIV98934.1 hypothetical protein TanjilG_07369 [Lupinus angustifolius]